MYVIFRKGQNYRDINQSSGGLEMKENIIYFKNFSWLHSTSPYPLTPAPPSQPRI